jgi:hypothetical protein
VDDDHVGALERRIEVEGVCIVRGRAQPRERRLEIGQRLLAVVRREIAPAPAVGRFVNRDLVSPRRQFPNDAAQEMRVAVVPVGHQRVIEEDELHDRRPFRSRPL